MMFLGIVLNYNNDNFEDEVKIRLKCYNMLSTEIFQFFIIEINKFIDDICKFLMK